MIRAFRDWRREKQTPHAEACEILVCGTMRAVLRINAHIELYLKTLAKES